MIRAYILKKNLNESESSTLRLVISLKALLLNNVLVFDDEFVHPALVEMSDSWKEATPTQASAYLAQAEVKPKTTQEQLDDLKTQVAANTDSISTIAIATKTDISVKPTPINPIKEG